MIYLLTFMGLHIYKFVEYEQLILWELVGIKSPLYSLKSGCVTFMSKRFNSVL